MRPLKIGIAAIAIWLLTASYVKSGDENLKSSISYQVPFKLERNRVIIPVSVNGSRELDILLDTGMRFDGVYLFHKELADEIDMSGAIEVRVPGAGSGEASTAMMIESGKIKFGDVVVDSQKVIISQSAHTQGFGSDGVIGWNLFGHYTVGIDYDNERIALHNTSFVQADTTWQTVPIVLKDDIPFLDAAVEAADGEKTTMSLYIDLASGDALELLVRPDQKFKMPDNLEKSYLGTGLSGDIYGSYGRTKSLTLGTYQLRHIKTAFAPAEVRSKQQRADGILGDDCMRRFNIIFDYTHGFLYLKPNSYFETPFE